MNRPLRTVLVGFGNIGAGYANDPLMARYYPYATHAQVLRDHPAFEWCGVVDVASAAREEARARWGVPHVGADLGEVARACSPEVAILATPPGLRMRSLEELPRVRAVLVEKPLGETKEEADEFVRYCGARKIAVQVNLWRRADTTFRALAAGGLQSRIGPLQGASGIYGNGLLNNGTHLVDFIRMLFGEVVCVQAAAVAPYREGPIPGDVNVPFFLHLESGPSVACLPVSFEHYRENGVEAWGRSGRLVILQEGLRVEVQPVRENRAMRGEREIASDRPEPLETTVGDAMYRMYDNLAESVLDGAELWSPASSALRTARVVQSVLDSVAAHGGLVDLRPEAR